MAEKQMDLREAVEKCQRMRAVVDAARAWVEYVRFWGYAKGMHPESAAGELLAAVDALAAHEQPTDSPAAPGAPSAPRREKGSCDGGQPGRIRPAGPTSKPQPMDGLQKAVQRARALMSYSEPEVGAYGPLPDKVEEADEILREVEAALSAPSPSSATLREAVLRVVRCKRQTADDSCLLVPMADFRKNLAKASIAFSNPQHNESNHFITEIRSDHLFPI